MLPGRNYKTAPAARPWRRKKLIAPPEVTNTGPGFNRGSGGGVRGCGFEERVGVYARTGGIHFLWLLCLRVCGSLNGSLDPLNIRWITGAYLSKKN